MKTTLLKLTIMATLAIFSTLTSEVYAQKTSMASMTVKATVVETASVHSLNEMIFDSIMISDSGVHTSTSNKAEFVLSGAVGSEVNITMNASEKLEDGNGNSIYFRPLVQIGNSEVVDANFINSQVNLMAQPKGFSGKTSVWVEGMITSNSEIAQTKFSGDYLVSVSYN
jgi:hypothetical protein